MLLGAFGRQFVGDQRGANSREPVGGDRHPLAGIADENPRSFSGGHFLSHRFGIDGVIVAGVKLSRTKILIGLAQLPEPTFNLFFECKPTVIGSKVDHYLHFSIETLSSQVEVAPSLLTEIPGLSTIEIMKITLKDIKKETPDTKSFIFGKPAGLTFTPGQLLHWTLPHGNPDNRGIRRPFTISSSPTEDFLMFTTKFTDEAGSSFKLALEEVTPGTEFEIDDPVGVFTLPEDQNQPVTFLGGGVGVTPFRSMIKFATDEKLSRPLTLLYANKTPADIIFRQEFDAWAKENPHFKLAYTVDTPDESWSGEVGHLSPEMIKKHIADPRSQIYLICGPAGMIASYREVLGKLGLGDEFVRTENFSGYA